MMLPIVIPDVPRRSFFYAISVFLLTIGCDVPAPKVLDPSTPSGAPPAFVREIPKGHAVVAVVRGRELAGRANSWRFFVNGTAVADLDVGMRHWQPVSAGPVQLRAEVVTTIENFGLGVALSEKPVLNLTAKAGQIYLFEMDPGFAGGPVFKSREAGALQEASNYIDAPLPAR